MKSSTALCLLATAQLAQATPLPVEPFPIARSWPLPGGISGATLTPGEAVTTSITAPPLSSQEASLPGEWRGIVGVDVFGTTTGQPGGALLELVDPDSHATLASASIEIATPAPGAFWSPLVSSEHPGEGVDHVFDANPTTDWHSNYRGEKTPGPHWIGAEFLECSIRRFCGGGIHGPAAGQWSVTRDRPEAKAPRQRRPRRFDVD